LKKYAKENPPVFNMYTESNTGLFESIYTALLNCGLFMALADPEKLHNWTQLLRMNDFSHLANLLTPH